MPSVYGLRGWWRGILTPPCLFLVLSTRSIADWLKPPDTWFLLDFIKPEFLLLRVSAPFCICASACVCLCSLFPPFHNLVYLSFSVLPLHPWRLLLGVLSCGMKSCLILSGSGVTYLRWENMHARSHSIIETYFWLWWQQVSMTCEVFLLKFGSFLSVIQ